MRCPGSRVVVAAAARAFVLAAAHLLTACGPTDEPPDGPASTVTIRGEVTCAECEIELGVVATLGDLRDSTSIREDAAGRSCMVGRLSGGDFVVSGLVGGGRLAVYGGAGPAVRYLGRPGQGPGEFGAQLRVWVGPGDTLHVVDDRNARLQVLTASGEPVRTFPLPARYRPFARLEGSGWLFHRTPTGPEDPMFHVVDAAGTRLHAFGSPTLEEFDLESWRVTPRPGGGFWTASMWRYELFGYAEPGAEPFTVRREADWFPGGVWYSDDLYVAESPGSHLVRMWEDEQGLIWVYSGVADAEWRPNEVRIPDPDWHRENFDLVIEVLDPVAGEVVATGRHHTMLGEVCGSPLMYEVEYTGAGDTRMVVLEPRLIRPE